MLVLKKKIISRYVLEILTALKVFLFRAQLIMVIQEYNDIRTPSGYEMLFRNTAYLIL